MVRRSTDELLSMLPPEDGDPMEAIEWMWEWRAGLPFPRYRPLCPQCERRDTLIRQWTFRSRANEKLANVESPRLGRCDVSFKCPNCSMVWFHGIVITDEQYEVAMAMIQEDCNCPARVVHHREARRILAGEAEA